MGSGRVVVLNGSSSAGKSSLARELQARWAARGEPWVIFGWDDFPSRLPARWHAGPGHDGDLAADGVAHRWVGEDAAILELGPLGQRMLEGYHRAVAALARSGLDVLVDEVLMSAHEWDDWQRALEGIDVRWVGVRCAPDVVAERERVRGDRWPGLARGTAGRVHQHASYDVEVDTASMTVEEAADAVDEGLSS